MGGGENNSDETQHRSHTGFSVTITIIQSMSKRHSILLFVFDTHQEKYYGTAYLHVCFWETTFVVGEKNTLQFIALLFI